jgi:hypothetical protein
MTVYIRDQSHFDGDSRLAGYVGTTHKSSEGTGFTDPRYGGVMNAYRRSGVPVLGAYHVVRSGDLDAQVDHWFAVLDAQTPWWRTQKFILQIDLEKWPADQVSAATGKTFAAKVKARAPRQAWVITYASHGQYGNSLLGIVTDLWNADYASGGSYPGDNWAPLHSFGRGGWAPYSGKTPVLLQFTSTPYDKNAFRGTLEQLLAQFPGATPAGGGTMPNTDQGLAADKVNSFINPRVGAVTLMSPKILEGPQVNQPVPLVNFLIGLKADIAAVSAAVVALAQLMTPPMPTPTVGVEKVQSHTAGASLSAPDPSLDHPVHTVLDAMNRARDEAAQEALDELYSSALAWHEEG